MLTAAEFEALRLTGYVALVSVACSLPGGMVVAWILGRCNFRGKALLESATNLPLVMPPVVTGYLLLVIFGAQGVIGKHLAPFGLQFIFDFKGAVLASSVMAFPLLVRPMRLSFAQVDRRLEMAARTLGASGFDAFLTITLPLSYPGIIAGAVLAFARAMGEFGATIMLAGNIPGETRTVSLYIYGLLESPGGMDRAPVLVAWCIAISIGALVAGNYLERHGQRYRNRG